MLDLAIRDGLIVDGTGAPGRIGDVGIDGEWIAEIDEVGPARRNIDAAGLVVTPGFVDAHTHDDMELHRNSANPNKLLQGVTTVICGSCGFSAFPHQPGRPSLDLLATDGPWTNFGEYTETLETRGLGPNMATFVGHNTVLLGLTGLNGQRPNQRQREAVSTMVRRAVEAGALGVSTGLIYEPGKHATTEDLIELARGVADLDGIYSTHLRDEGPHLMDAIDEALLVGTQAGVAVQISHLKTIWPPHWGTIQTALDRIDAAYRDGLDVAFDVYPYVAGSGPIAQYFDPDHIDTDRVRLVQMVRCLDYPQYEGRRLSEIADDEGRSLADITIKVITAPLAEHSLCVIFEINEADMRTVLSHPRSMIGSDGIPQTGGVPHPRLLGSFPRTLGQFSRDEALFDLPTAVAKMTSIPAHRYRLAHRGRLACGKAADVTIFDYPTINDAGSYDRRANPTGIKWVVVNGHQSVTPSGIKPGHAGKVLRRATNNH